MKFSIIWLIFCLPCLFSCEYKSYDLSGKLYFSGSKEVTEYDFKKKKSSEYKILEKLNEYKHENVTGADFSINFNKFYVSTTGSTSNIPVLLEMSYDSENIKILEKKAFLKGPSISPDGKILSYIYSRYVQSSPFAVDNWFIYVSANGEPSSKLLDMPVNPSGVSWFNDSKKIVFSAKDYKVYIYDFTTQQLVKIIDFGVYPSVSADGTKIAYFTNDVDDKTKQRLIDWQMMKMDDYAKKYNPTDQSYPGGDRKTSELLYKKSLKIYDIESKKTKNVADDLWVSSVAVWAPDGTHLAYTHSGEYAFQIFTINLANNEIDKLSGHRGQVFAWH